MLVINKVKVRELVNEMLDTRYKGAMMSAYRPTKISKQFFEAVNREVHLFIGNYIATRKNGGKTL